MVSLRLSRFPFGRHALPLPRSLIVALRRRVGSRYRLVSALALPVLLDVGDLLAKLVGALLEPIGLGLEFVGQRLGIFLFALHSDRLPGSA